MRIRSETILDYCRIAEINALAFAPYLEEPLTSTFVSEFRLVDALRHGESFDLSFPLWLRWMALWLGTPSFTPTGRSSLERRCEPCPWRQLPSPRRFSERV